MQSVSADFTPTTTATVRQVVAKLEVQWDGTNWDDESQYLFRHDGQIRLNAPGEDLIPPGDVGICSIGLFNESGRFSWKRTDGALYAYIGGDAGLTGKRVRLYQGFVVSGTPEYVRIFSGVIANWSEDRTNRTVTLHCRDMGWEFLQQRASTSMYVQVRVDEWVTALADLAGISSGDRIFDTSLFTVPYAWLDDEPILDEMWAAAQADGGRIYYDQMGKLRFENAAHWLTTPHQTSQWSFHMGRFADQVPQYLPEDLATQVVIEWSGRVASKESTVYTLDVLKTIPPGKTITWEARLSQPAQVIADLVKGTDYRAFSSGGLDLTNSVSITTTKYAQRVTLEAVNAHTTLNALLIFFRLRGIPLTGGPTQEIVEAVGSPPLAFTRTRSVRGNQYIQTHAQAAALAQFLRDRHKQLLPIWPLRGVQGVPQLELGDRVGVTDTVAMTGTRYGYAIGIRWSFDAERPMFTQDVDVLDAEDLFPYLDYFVIGTTALGSAGRVWY